MMVFRIKNIILAAILCLAALLAMLYVIDSNSRLRSTYTALPVKISAPVIIDAGHGGLDGGAVSKDGIAEAEINLAISHKTCQLMAFVGIPCFLTREDDGSLDFDESAGVRGNKNADLHARNEIAQQNPGSPFLSIHLNKFSQEKYHGAQVFYSENSGESQLIANALQVRLRAVLDPANSREAKPAPDGVFLMEQIQAPAVTIECGFLSNSSEAALLQQDSYQTKISLAILAGYIDYLYAD